MLQPGTTTTSEALPDALLGQVMALAGLENVWVPLPSAACRCLSHVWIVLRAGPALGVGAFLTILPLPCACLQARSLESAVAGSACFTLSPACGGTSASTPNNSTDPTRTLESPLNAGPPASCDWRSGWAAW